MQLGGIGEFTLTADTPGALPGVNLFGQRLDSYNLHVLRDDWWMCYLMWFSYATLAPFYSLRPALGYHAVTLRLFYDPPTF